MKNKILLPILVLFISAGFSLNAQSTYEMQCQMTVEEIQLQQSWDIDDPTSETTQNIAIELIKEINALYAIANGTLAGDIVDRKENISNAVVHAVSIGMNYSMFDADLEIIATIE